jgi:hypothetical protein
VYALVQHVTVWASEPELAWTVADRAMAAAQAADTPAARASAAWTLGMVHRTTGDIDGALDLATGAINLLAPRLDDGGHDLAGLAGALMLHAALTSARTYHQCRDYTATLHWLEYAHQTAPDSVHYSPTARQMTADTLDHGSTLITQRARDLATSISLHL